MGAKVFFLQRNLDLDGNCHQIVTNCWFVPIIYIIVTWKIRPKSLNQLVGVGVSDRCVCASMAITHLLVEEMFFNIWRQQQCVHSNTHVNMVKVTKRYPMRPLWSTQPCQKNSTNTKYPLYFAVFFFCYYHF